MSVANLPVRHAQRWEQATRHAFVTAVRDGHMPRPAFDTWLAQDYRFVADLLQFQARLLARSPRPAQHVLANGIVALVDELSWFERQANVRHIDLAAAPMLATAAYGALLKRLDDADVAVALAMLWAMERTYRDAWSFAAPGAPEYQEFVAHWTTPQFSEYVAELEATADEVIRTSGQVPLDDWFTEIVEAEVRFWDMAWGQAA